VSDLEPPANVKRLNSALEAIARDRGVLLRRLQRVVANTVLGQLLPAGVVKGGTSLTLRAGEANSRFTPDFDTAFGGELETFENDLSDRLEDGWCAFTGTIVRQTSHAPAGMLPQYVMQPFAVKLQYQKKSWLTVDLEMGHDEIGCAANPELRIADDIVALFARLGLQEPGPVPVMAIEHQMAQKLHACTSPGSQRAHDVVDLQLLNAEHPDLSELRAVAIRLFKFRSGHTWPPAVPEADATWTTVYTEAADGVTVLQSAIDAVAWANALISDINSAAS